MESRFGHEIDLGDGNPEQWKAPLEKLRELFAEKKRLTKLTLIFHKDCERALEHISFDGRALASAGECDVVLGILELEESRKSAPGIGTSCWFPMVSRISWSLTAKRRSGRRPIGWASSSDT